MGLPGSVYAGFVRRFHDFAALNADLRIIVQQLVGDPDQLALNLVRQEFLAFFAACDFQTEGDPFDLAGSGTAFGQLDHAEVFRFSDNLRTFLRKFSSVSIKI